MLHIHPNAHTLPATRAETPSTRPHQLPWKATEEERAIVCTLRRAANVPLDASPCRGIAYDTSCHNR